MQHGHLRLQEASRLEQQTHVAYRDGFYVNGLPLAKAYREVAASVRGRGGGAFANCYPAGGTANADMARNLMRAQPATLCDPACNPM